MNTGTTHHAPHPSGGEILSSAPTRWHVFLFYGGIGFALVSFLSGTVRFWDSQRVDLVPSAPYGIAVGLLLSLVGFALNRWTIAGLQPTPLRWGVMLPILFLTDWLCRNYSFFPGPSIRGEVFLGLAASWIVLRRHLWLPFPALAATAILMAMYSFFGESEGRLLFSDDHATFLFRLQLLKENFPSIPFYSPLWNGGFDARDFFATGALNFFLLGLPFVYLTDLSQSYNVLVATVLFLLVPLCSWYTVRLERVPPPGPAIAAILSLSVSLLWYKWGLKYGTMGFIISTTLAPVVYTLSTRLMAPGEELSRFQAFIFVGATSLMLMWTPLGLAFLPLGVIAPFFLRTIIRKRQIAWIVALLCAINLPWIALFWQVSNVGSFLKAEESGAISRDLETLTDDTSESGPAINALEKSALPLLRPNPSEPRSSEQVASSPRPVTPRVKFRQRASGINLRAALEQLREKAVTTNPLILVFALPGLLLLTPRSRTLFLGLALWLLVLGALCVPLKPQLELDRMLVVLAVLSIIPASHALADLFNSARELSSLAMVIPALAGGVLCASPFVTSSVLRNRSLEQYHFADDNVRGLVNALKADAEKHSTDGSSLTGGRVLFSGCILHELSHGHLAPLSLMSARPLMASTYVHNLWWYQDIIPNDFLQRGDEGIKEYLRHYNVSQVVAHEKKWRAYFDARSNEYLQAWRGDGFALYHVVNPANSYIELGEGQLLRQSSNDFVVRTESDDLVVRFNYFPFLEVEGCRAIEPFPLAATVTFVRLIGCSIGGTAHVKSTSPLTRFFRQRKIS